MRSNGARAEPAPTPVIPAKGPRKAVEGKKRLVADVPAALHRSVRLHCLSKGIDVKDYLIELLVRDGR